MDPENIASQAPAESVPPTAPPAPAQVAKKKKGRPAWKTLLIVFVWVVVVAGIVFLTLFLASRIGQFESIGHMLEYIRGVLNL